MARRLPPRDSKGRFKKRRGMGKSKAKKSGTKGLGATFKAKKSYAVTKKGTLRKGCRKVKTRRGTVEFRCRRPGKKR